VCHSLLSPTISDPNALRRYRYLKLIGDQSVKETDVGIPEPSQEDVLFNIRSLAPELGKGTLLLSIERLDIDRTQS